ncbi:MAG: ABC transporter substrate-binding protein [Clostridiales bacterium]|nr:ABC transporter substrate-binding protein [Clostridiales bacterium]
MLFTGSSVSDDTASIAEVNKYLAEIGSGLAVKPIWGTWGDFDDKATNALDTGDTSIDIYFTASWSADNYTAYAKKGAWVRLDDPANNLLEQYGADMKAAVPQVLWDGFTIGGSEGRGIYAVPGYKDYAQMYTWDVNNTRLAELGAELGITFDDIPWSAELFFAPEFAAALQMAKDKYGPDFYPLWLEAEPAARSICSTDADPTGLLYYGFDPQDPRKPEKPVIQSRYDTEIYKRYLEKVREYYLAGYINPVLSNQQQANDALTAARQSGEYLISTMTYAYGYDKTVSLERGIDARFPPISQAIVSTGSVQGSGYAVSVYSQNKEAAVKFLNLWYTDSKLAALLAYGVEGTQYVSNPDGTIVFNTDERNAYLPWRNGMGNIFILPPEESAGVNYWNEFKSYNEAGVPTALLGFEFDTEPVKNQIAALSNVRDEYIFSLNTGAVDPAEKLPEFQEKLKANGIDEVIAEINSQLEAFFAQ